MTDGQLNGEHIEEAKEAAREEARAIGKRTVWAVLIAFLIFGACIFAAASVVTHINTQACADRQEGRQGIQELVLFVTGPEPKPGEDPQITGLRDLVLPGGKLEPIRC